ncbi:MAG: hypothetical protein RQ756_02365 [Flavobacteriaceae bacterium]|nr:hypothetical protein [Flavobacteriaceae bacterium]
MNTSFRKYLVLFLLFVMPLGVYLFFASGVHNFAKLGLAKPSITAFAQLPDQSTGEFFSLEDKISLITFFGENPEAYKLQSFNLYQKICSKYAGFDDFQCVTFVLPEAKQSQLEILQSINPEIEVTAFWKIVELSEARTKNLLQELVAQNATAYPNAFIIDKKLNLRAGDSKEEDVDVVLKGYPAKTIADINTYLADDIKVILAEYRLALKSNMSEGRYGQKK